MGCPKLDILEQDYTSFGLAEITAGSSLCSRESGCKTRKMYRYGFNGKERDLEGMGGGGSTYDYGFRIYNPQIAKFLSVDPLTKKYPMLTTYQFASNTPIMAIDIDGLEAYIVVFPDYKISTPLGQIGGLGHGGSLIINPSSGDAYYMEYGRYDSKQGNARYLPGRSHKIGTVEFGEDGLPTTASLSGVLGVISKGAGHGGRIEAAEFKTTQEEFDKMLSTHIQYLDEAKDPNRTPYELQGDDAHNCGTVACEVVSDNKENSGIPEKTNARPVKMLQEVLDASSNATRVGYDPNTNETMRGGSYIPSVDEKKTDEKIKQKDGN